MIDWALVGTAAGMGLSGLLGWFSGKGKRQVAESQDNAQIAGYATDRVLSDAAASQIKSLLDRVAALESSHTKLWTDQQSDKRLIVRLQVRQAQLEAILRQNNIPVPPEPHEQP